MKYLIYRTQLKKFARLAATVLTFAVMLSMLGCEPALDSVTSAKADNNNEDLSVQVAELKDDLESTRRKLEAANNQISQLNSQLEESKSESSQLQGSINSIRARFSESNSKLMVLVEEMNSVGTAIESLVPNNTREELQSDEKTQAEQESSDKSLDKK